MGGGLGQNPEEQPPLEAVPRAERQLHPGRGVGAGGQRASTVAVGCRGGLLARSGAGVALGPLAPHRLSRSPLLVLARGGFFAVWETEGHPLPPALPQLRLRRLPGLCCPLP